MLSRCQNLLFKGWILFQCVEGPRFVYPSIADGYLGRCHLLATVNHAAVNTVCRYLLETLLLVVLWGKHPGVDRWVT